MFCEKVYYKMNLRLNNEFKNSKKTEYKRFVKYLQNKPNFEQLIVYYIKSLVLFVIKTSLVVLRF